MFLGRSILRPTNLRSSLVRHATQREALRHGWRALSINTITQELSQTLAAQADELKTTKDPSTLHALYPAFVEDLRKARLESHISAPLQEQDVRRILRELASSARPQDLQRIEEVLYDMEPLFGIPPTIDVYTCIVEALGEKAHPRVGLNFLAKMCTLPGSFAPSVDHFISVLEPAIETVPFSFIRHAVSNMHRMGCRPNSDIANIVIRAYWKSVEVDGQKPTLESFAAILDLLESWKIPYSSSTANLITSLFDRSGLSASGQKGRNAYELRFRGTRDADALGSELSRVAETSGVKAACDLFKQSFTHPNAEAKSKALRYILQSSRKLSDIQVASEELNVVPDIRIWSIVLSNAARRDNLRETLGIYEAAKAQLNHIDAGLVAPIIRSIWRKCVPAAPENLVDQALSLYHDLTAAYPPEVALSQPEPGKGHLRSSRGPDDNIFHTLFRILTRNENPDKYYPVATQLVRDMRAYKIPAGASPVAASLICIGMQRCPSPEDALDIYHRYRKYLDADGYAVVLHHFSKKEFGPHYAPSIQDYFGIVRDMQRAGFEVTPKVYTIILTQIGLLASKLMKEKVPDQKFYSDLLAVTRRTHDILSLEASFSPDVMLMSQLLNTYQRLGCLGDAYRVWELMYLQGDFNPVTVSNILDGCGYAGDLQTASSIWRKLTRDGFSFDMNNWNAWVECLCRCGQLDMARKVVIEDMPRAGKTPTVETVNILLSFARGKKLDREILAQIQANFPSLYPRVVASSPSSSSELQTFD